MRLRLIVSMGIAAFLTACNAGATSPTASLPAGRAAQVQAPALVEQSVAFQMNAAHTGYARGPLRGPLKELWSVKIGSYYGNVPYPVIANGMVVVTASAKLIALDENTGKKLWSRDAGQAKNWIGPAYDNGKIFVSAWTTSGPKYAGVFAFDEQTGKEVWSAPTPDEAGGSSPPTAASGTLYTSAEEDDGYLYAYDESTGALKWMVAVPDAGSSPAVAPNGIFVSYGCPHTYDFNPGNGHLIWGHVGKPCLGGGDSTPVLYDNLLFLGPGAEYHEKNGFMLQAADGARAGTFRANLPPAFANHTGFFVNYNVLVARNIPSLKPVWSVTLRKSYGDGFSSAPLIVGNTVYCTTHSNALVGYDIDTGKQKVSTQLIGSSYYTHPSAGLGFGDGILVVPDGPYLIALKGS
jgi:outer membrane protein assembly factor BamB